jgi:Ca-activated chloride channel family protein
MTFTNPAALWLLALLPVIVLLYMLRARRHDLEVSSTLLWQRARTDLAAQRPVRRLERSVLLLLQLLAVVLAAAALSRPQLPLAGGGRGTVIVLDTSASMQATDVRPSRFAAAAAQATAAALRAPGPVMLIEAGARASIAVPYGGPDAVAAALAGSQPTDGPARLEQAVALGLGQRIAGIPPQVIVFTDRSAAPFPGVSYRVIGTSGANVAISGLHTDAAGDRTHVVVRVRTLDGTARSVPLELTLDGRRVLRQALSLPAAGEAVVSTVVHGSGVLRARVEVDDVLRVDNTRAAVIGRPPPRVLVVGAPDRALSEALAVLPIRVARVTQATAEQLAAADLVILDRLSSVALPPGNFLLIGTVPANLPIAAAGTVRRPSVLRVSASHPVTRYVDLSRLQILQALALQVRGGEVLAEGEVPLIWAYDGNGIRAVVMGFALDQSDLVIQVGFPIFLQNAVTWLVGADAMLTAGSPLIVPAGEQASASLDGPAGRLTLVASGGRFVVPSLERAGVYTFRAGSVTRVFAVVPPAEESDIAPGLPPSAASPAAPPGDARRHADLWPLFIAGVLIVLAVEWVLWLRRLPRVRGEPRTTHIPRLRGQPRTTRSARVQGEAAR